jgi:putative glutamine amidotransferase
MEDDKPLLAICRGMQVLNVALGGNLWQDLSVQLHGALQHNHRAENGGLMHRVVVEPGTSLHALAGAGEIEVNSRHHQAVREPARSLVVTARSGDGVIEGVEDPQRRFLVGLQCHPEDMYSTHPWARRLFETFVAATAGA